MTEGGFYYLGVKFFEDKPGELVTVIEGLSPDNQSEFLQGYADAAADYFFDILRKSFNNHTLAVRAQIMTDISSLMAVFNEGTT